MNDWEIKQLRHFKMIFELGSISKAASQLGLTQSALTKSLKKLEDKLDLVLFHRHTRELVATEAAEALYHNALEILASAADFSNKVAMISQGNFGQVNIACGPLIQQFIAEILIEKAIDRLPNLKLHISGGNFKTLSYGLLNHEFDFMLYDGGDIQTLNEPERFEVTPILKLPIVFLVSPKHPMYVSGESILEFKWALPSIPLRLKSNMPDKMISAGIPHYKLESMGQCINLAKRGLVVTAALRSVVKEELENGELVELDSPIKLSSNFALYRLRSRKMSDQALSVIELINYIAKENFK
jgi:DNA-binding transcriptional LysR family regulator